MHGHDVQHVPHDIKIHAPAKPTRPDTGKAPAPFLDQLPRSALVHEHPVLHPAAAAERVPDHAPGGAVPGGVVEREEEAVAVGEILHRLTVHRLERAHVREDALDAAEGVDRLVARDGGGRWRGHLVPRKDADVGEVLFHFVWGDEGEAAGVARLVGGYCTRGDGGDGLGVDRSFGVVLWQGTEEQLAH
jgi:hypothetical protein